jgi:Icc-related predicted phosphoesterase
MKILAFTDLHANKQALESIKSKAVKSKPELLVFAGDLSSMGKGLDATAHFLNNLNINILLIPGNHESEKEIIELCKKYSNLINIHRGIYEYKNYLFFGWGNSGFSFVEPNFERIIKEFKKDYDGKKKIIFVTHAPIFNTLLDFLHGKHNGCKSTRNFVEQLQPKLTLCGHFHEAFYMQDKIKESLIINPGCDGTIIELED